MQQEGGSCSEDCSRRPPRPSYGSYNRYDSTDYDRKAESDQYYDTVKLKESNYADFLTDISNGAKKNGGKNSKSSSSSLGRPTRRYDRYDTVDDKGNKKYLCDIDILETEFPHVAVKAEKKPERKFSKPDQAEPPRVYEAMSRCSNDADSVNSFMSDSSKGKSFPVKAVPHYVDMARPYKDNSPAPVLTKELSVEREIKVYTRALQDNSNRLHNGARADKSRRHTTEYRGPQLALPPLIHDSSDSAERSPIATKSITTPYPYSVLPDQRITKKKTSITSSTSEENGDIIAAAIKMRMQTKDWRENKAPKRVDSLTVDRRATTKKNSSKSAKIKRRGSFNIDPTGEFHLSLEVNKEKDMSCSVRSCSTAKSPLMDARKTPLQISAEDMVQIANCGARNKNGSLCHFISTNDENYLSISQALLDQSSGSEAKLTDDILPRKYYTVDRSRKKSTHSLAYESSDDTLCQIDKAISKERKDDKIFPKYRDIEPKMNSIDMRHKAHPRQRSHDIEKSLKSAKHKPDSTPGRKLVHTKSEGHRSHKTPQGYFLLEDDCTMPVRLQDIHRKESLKYQSPSTETLDKPRVHPAHLHKDHEACKCLAVSSHSLAKGDYREKSDFSSDTDPGHPAFHRLGTSSREELASAHVEESFDF